MKKSLLIMFIFGISIFISSLAIAGNYGNHGDKDDCDALDGKAYGLCNAYCFAKACATDDPNGNPESCAKIKEKYMEVTGISDLPCDIITCGICADMEGFGTIGECDERKLVDCADPMQSYGPGIDCEDVSLPAAPMSHPIFNLISCANMAGYIPDCQNGVPDFVCEIFVEGAYILPEGEVCPFLPSCFE